MPDLIFRRDRDGPLRAMVQQACDSGDLLQSLIERYPDVLALGGGVAVAAGRA